MTQDVCRHLYPSGLGKQEVLFNQVPRSLAFSELPLYGVLGSPFAASCIAPLLRPGPAPAAVYQAVACMNLHADGSRRPPILTCQHRHIETPGHRNSPKAHVS